MPRWIELWLGAYGVSVEAFKTFLATLADAVDLPEEWRRQVEVWLDQNATISPQVVIAFVALVYAELKSGAPGYNPDAGGLA